MSTVDIGAVTEVFRYQFASHEVIWILKEVSIIVSTSQATVSSKDSLIGIWNWREKFYDRRRIYWLPSCKAISRDSLF